MEDLIFDRTEQDVLNAILLREEKVKNFQELTDDDIVALERGMFTVGTLERIEESQSELKQEINSIGYWNTNTENRSWGNSDIFDEENFNRILENLNKLKRAFFVYEETPKTPTMSYNYKTINDIEKIIFDFFSMVDDVKENYRECGTFECGE